ncbi:MAG: hypothetical protein U1D69_04350 [Polynucleobacter sp.]|nr:hypothetical protein [Polynucleobacter sp.]
MSSGGRRKGAGRPTKDGIGRKRLTVALREDLLAELTHQAEALKCSLSDRVNALLAEQFVERNAPVSNPLNKAAAARMELKQAPENPSGSVRPVGDEETESVPSYRELDELVKKWLYRASSVNRRSQQIQYWRKAYRKDKAFRDALDTLAGKVHSGLKDLLLDNHLPLSSHKEVLALAELPADTLKLTIARLLRGTQSLKNALGAAAETFRQIAAAQARRSDKLYTSYYFFEEL